MIGSRSAFAANALVYPPRPLQTHLSWKKVVVYFAFKGEPAPAPLQTLDF